MVRVPWFGDCNAPKPSESSVSDADIKRRADEAADRARRAKELVDKTGGKLRHEEAIKYVRNNE